MEPRTETIELTIDPVWAKAMLEEVLRHQADRVAALEDYLTAHEDLPQAVEDAIYLALSDAARATEEANTQLAQPWATALAATEGSE